jgi:phage terminase large subunit GpA-like protein
MAELAYADAHDLVGDIFAGLAPPELIDVPGWAVRDRWLNNAGGGHVGQYSHEKAPYTVWPSRCLTSLEYLTVAVVGPGQVGKTVIAENWLGHSVVTDAADMLWYMQSDDGIESYVKGTINPFITDHDCLLDRLGKRPVDDSLHFKRFKGMSVEFLSFGPRTIINKSAPRIVADEVDNYQWLGDVQPVLDVRRQTFGQHSMVLALSHPDLARGMNPAEDWTAGIMAFYADSTRCTWWWKCPHCGAFSSPNPNASRYMVIHYPDDDDVPLDVVEREARLLCPVNGCLIENHHREAMNLSAFRNPGSLDGWIGEGMEIAEDGTVTGELAHRDTAGVWIVGAMSPFVLGGIGGLAKSRVKAERAFEVAGEELVSPREVIVKKWGLPYSPKKAKGTVDANTLADRAEHELKLGVVPHGVRFITLAVDVQAWGFDYLARGWGRSGESWIVDQGRIATNPATGRPVEPATSEADWDLLLELFHRVYPLADGSGRVMKIRAMGYDSGGQAGVTAKAYAAHKRWRKVPNGARTLGKIAGREVWTIIPTKGGKGRDEKRLTVTYPDTQTTANKAAARGEVPIALFNPNLFKDDLSGQLQTAEPGPGFIHFPTALKAAKSPHPWFEQLVSEHEKTPGRWEKIKANAKNEALDLMVINQVVAHLHGATRITWDAPPAWAAEWDNNVSVIDPATLAADAKAVGTAGGREAAIKAMAGRLPS